MERGDVCELIYREFDRYFDVKSCPNCNKDVLMIKFDIEGKDEDGEWIMNQMYRCIGCLNVFKEDLKKV